MYLTVKAVASRYQIHPASIWRWVRVRNFPKPIRLSRGSTRWCIDDLVAWERQLEVKKQ